MSSNNTTTANVVSTVCPLTDAVNMISTYVNPAICVVGFITNTICIIVFAMILMGERSLPGQMFKYLLFKAINDALLFLTQVFAPLYYCATCSTYQTLATQIWYVWLFYYLRNVVELASGFLEVAATFDCLICIKQKFAHLKTNLTCYIVVISLTVFSAIFYIFRLMVYDIVEKRSAKNVTMTTSEGLNRTMLITSSYYVIQSTAFSKSVLNKVFMFVHVSLRDALVMILTIILNIFLVGTLKDSVRLKKRIVSSRTSVMIMTTTGEESMASTTCHTRTPLSGTAFTSLPWFPIIFRM